jgi:signal transduction histidine kinase
MDHRESYRRSRQSDVASSIQGWLDREQLALQQGRRGLRVAGNPCWLEGDEWPEFLEYERAANFAFQQRHIVGICSYCYGHCSARNVIDVMDAHEFALARSGYEWRVVDSSSMALARQEVLHFRQLADRLREENERKDEFMAIFSQALRGPITPLATASQLLRLSGARNELGQVLSIVDRQVFRLTKLINDVLDLARIARGKLELRRETSNLFELVNRAVEATGEMIAQRRHRLRLNVPRLIEVDVDGDRFVQVVTNLIANAAQYTQSSAYIAVSAKLVDGIMALTVADNGPGIAPELQRRIFEPFRKRDRARVVPQEGLGLGLPLVKRLIELHGGSIQLRSNTGGTAITVQLPARSAAAPVEREFDDFPTTGRSGGRILIVDDNEDAALLLAEVLRTCNFGVQVAPHAVAALQLASYSVFDAAILDLELQTMDGFQLATELRHLPGWESTKLIGLSSCGDSRELARARELGFVHRFIKPLDVEVLVHSLSDWLTLYN